MERYFLCCAYDQDDQLIFEAGIKANSIFFAQKRFENYLSISRYNNAINYTNVDTTSGKTKEELMTLHSITGLFFLEVIEEELVFGNTTHQKAGE